MPWLCRCSLLLVPDDWSMGCVCTVWDLLQFFFFLYHWIPNRGVCVCVSELTGWRVIILWRKPQVPLETHHLSQSLNQVWSFGGFSPPLSRRAVTWTVRRSTASIIIIVQKASFPPTLWALLGQEAPLRGILQTYLWIINNDMKNIVKDKKVHLDEFLFLPKLYANIQSILGDTEYGNVCKCAANFNYFIFWKSLPH